MDEQTASEGDAKTVLLNGEEIPLAEYTKRIKERFHFPEEVIFEESGPFVEVGDQSSSGKPLTPEEAEKEMADFMEKMGPVPTGGDSLTVQVTEKVVLPEDDLTSADYRSPTQSAAEREAAAKEANFDFAETLDMPIDPLYALGLIRAKVDRVVHALDMLEGVLVAEKKAREAAETMSDEEQILV